MDQLTRAVVEDQRRLENLLRRFEMLNDRLKWAEQRIRELSQSPTQIFGLNYDDIANRIHATAKVTGGTLTAATDATTPGSGTIRRYTTFDGTNVGGLLDIDEPCYNIFIDKGIAENATVEVIWKLGAWWVINVDSCSDLI